MAMASTKSAGTNPTDTSSSGTTEKKAVQQGLLYMLTTESLSATKSSGKPDAYPTEVYLPRMIHAVEGILNELLDDSNYPAEVKTALKFADNASPFGKFRTEII